MLGHVRRWLCMSQEERLGQNLTQLELHLGLLSYQNCEKQISLVKLPSQGILLCRPEKSNIELFLHSTFPIFTRREECYR